MNEERTPRLERMLEATARKVSGGQVHPLELLQQIQTAAESSVRDGAVANGYIVTLSRADHAQYGADLGQLCRDGVALLRRLESRNGWRRIGEFSVEFAASADVPDGAPSVATRFAERPRALNQPPAGATRAITRHRDLVLRLADGSAIRLTHTPFTIGRGPGNDLVLPVLSLSRRHAEILSTPDGLLIRDLGSRNGLVVGGERVTECLFDEGVSVVMGDVELRLERT